MWRAMLDHILKLHKTKKKKINYTFLSIILNRQIDIN